MKKILTRKGLGEETYIQSKMEGTVEEVNSRSNIRGRGLRRDVLTEATDMKHVGENEKLYSSRRQEIIAVKLKHKPPR